MNLNLKKLIALDACKDGLRCYKKNDCPLTVEETVLKLMDSNEPGKFKWSNWLLTHVFTKEQNIQYAVFAAEQVLFIFEKQFPENFRVRNAINSAKKYLKSPLKKKSYRRRRRRIRFQCKYKNNDY